MKRRLLLLGALLALSLGLVGWWYLSRGNDLRQEPLPPTSGPTASPRPGAGAPEAPVKPWAGRLDRPGLPNLHRVSETLYRGAQPTAAGFAELEKMGVRTVVNLRSAHSDRDLLANSRLHYVQIPTTASEVNEEAIIRFLRIAGDPDRAPVFVHCQHGADRTGVMVACYRVVVQGWSQQEAIAEMTRGGFGFHSIYTSTLVPLVEQADPARLWRLSRPLLQSAPAAAAPREAEAP